MDEKKRVNPAAGDSLPQRLIRILIITVIAIAAVIIIVTISFFTFNLLIKEKVEKQLAFSAVNQDAIYQRQLAELINLLEKLSPENRQIIRNYITQYHALLLNEIERIDNASGQ